MEWFVIELISYEEIKEIAFQTKLTYGMICYTFEPLLLFTTTFTFQTKLTYGMICYH